MADAYIKLYKKMLDWEWYGNVNTFRLFMHCLLKANWKQTKWQGITLKPGQFITSLANLAEETQLTVQEVRTALTHLKSTGELTSHQQGNFRIVTVVKWGEYQQSNKQINKASTTDKEYKEYKNKYIEPAAKKKPNMFKDGMILNGYDFEALERDALRGDKYE